MSELGGARYLAEGGLHVVLALGAGRVLRLRKRAAPPAARLDEFVRRVMLPLLCAGGGGRARAAPRAVRLAEAELAALHELLARARPARRGAAACCREATLAPDYTRLPGGSAEAGDDYCVEIKPKFGYMPKQFEKHGKCSYCLKQYLKLSLGSISSVGGYCPLDLFSGDRTRMNRTLLNLTKNPQNNLRFFKNSTVIFDESYDPDALDDILQNIPQFMQSKKEFLNFLVEILLADQSDIDELKICSLKSSFTLETENSEPLKQCDSSKIALNQNSPLGRLLFLQKLYIHELESVEEDIYGYVGSILNVIGKNNFNFMLQEERDAFIKKCDETSKCMLAAVARDCSIMISFSTNTRDARLCRLVSLNGKNFAYNISITDLEPKPTTTIEKRKRVDLEAISAYNKIVNQRHEEIQPHSETRGKQLAAWQALIVDYLKSTKQSTIDIREAQNSELFNNTTISRKLSQESILLILEDMSKNGRAAPTDKSKTVWEVYWHSLDEWGNMIYSWACNNGINNTVCTLFELREGENTLDEEFHQLDMNILVKALKTLEVKGKCELIEFDDNQGVKFF